MKAIFISAWRTTWLNLAVCTIFWTSNSVAEEAAQPAKRASRPPISLERAVQGAVKNLLKDLGGLFGAPQRAAVQKNDNEQQIKQMAAQYEAHFRPQLLAELEYIRQHCELPKEARPKLRGDGESALKEAVLEYARWRFIPRRRGNSQPDPGTIIREKLNKSMTTALSDGQLAKYQKIVAARDECRKEAAIRATVVLLDDILSLSAEQRDKISASIASKWEASWESWNNAANYNGMYVPQMPDDLVVPHLDDEQKKVWQGLQKISFGGWFPQLQGFPVDDDWWGYVKPAPAAAEGVLELAPAPVE
jgi:hypothetical protein